MKESLNAKRVSFHGFPLGNTRRKSGEAIWLER
jgi:hypothetical protein